MTDPRSGSGPETPDSGHGPPPPPPAPPYPHGSEQDAQPAMPALVNYLSIGLFVLVALQVLSAVITLAGIDTAVQQVQEQAASAPGMSPEQLEAGARIAIIGSAVMGVVFAAVFLWLTLMVRKGRNWARITSTVFLALGIVTGLIGLASGSVLGVVMLLLEIAVLVMLWMRPSNEYFRPAGRRV